MSSNYRADGFSAVEIFVVVLVIAVLGAVGFVGYNNFIAAKDTDHGHEASLSSDHEQHVPAVDSDDDLDKAAASVDDASFDKDGADEFERLSSQF